MRSAGKSGKWLWPLLPLLGLLPVFPVLLARSPILNNDMLVAYFCYFWDYHKNWSWTHPLLFWSSSYQCGMPMHAYWQSGWLYPVTWILFGPLSPHYGIYFFYAFHFALGIFGFLKLGPRLRLARPASLWAGICFSLSGTMLARYEHATFLAGWAWIPLVLAAFLSLRDRPGPAALFAYALCVALQAVGGHPQASVVTALIIAAFTVTAVLRGAAGLPARAGRGGGSRTPVTGGSPIDRAAGFAAGGAARGAAWLLGGHLLALLYCAPLVVPFLHLVNETDRFDGVAWEEGKASESDAAAKLEEGVFSFQKFSTGGMRPLHLLSLAAPHALGSPSDASWWGGEAWGEVFIYIGALGLFFCFSASWRRAGSDMTTLWVIGAVSLWLAAGAHFGASQILYHVPVLNNFRRPARFVILFVLAMSALSGHGFQRWTARAHRARGLWISAALFLSAAAALFALRAHASQLIAFASHFKRLDPSKDYAGKISTLLSDGGVDVFFLSLSAAALAYCALARPGRGARLRQALLFAVLVADLTRLHWDHFYRFPASYYRTPPASAAVLDQATTPFWRVSHYLEYPGLESWNMHNDPLAHLDLFEREKNALSCGIHAVFGYRHVSAHLPLMWKWEAGTRPSDKAARYLFANRALDVFRGDSLKPLGRFGEITAYELTDWRPRIELISPAAAAAATPSGATAPGAGPPATQAPAAPAADSTPCPSGYAGHGGLCVREIRDGEISVRAPARPFPAGVTVMIRERFQPQWRYRESGGPWKAPLESREHFLLLPVTSPAASLDLSYRPADFYRLAGLGGIVTALVLLGFGFVSRRKSHARRSP